MEYEGRGNHKTKIEIENNKIKYRRISCKEEIVFL